MFNEEENVFTYLDALRESGITNMFGASPYIEDKFGVSDKEARKLLLKWIKTFDQRHPRSE